MNARKGLRRAGMRSYQVSGPRGTWVIERDRPWRFIVRPADWPKDPRGLFFSWQFKRLFMARAHAEAQAGLPI